MKNIKIKWGNDTFAIGKQKFIKRQREKYSMIGESMSVKLEYSNWNKDYDFTMPIKKQYNNFFKLKVEFKF